MNRPPVLTQLQDGINVLRFNQEWRVGSVAAYMIGYRGPLMVKEVTQEAYCDIFETYARGYHEKTGSLIHFSRDIGMHTIGWVADPLCDRAVHLWLQFYGPGTDGRPTLILPPEMMPVQWIRAFFGPTNFDKVWCEPPIDAQARLFDSWHYRMFLDKSGAPLHVGGDCLPAKGWLLLPDLLAERRRMAGAARAN